MNIFPIELYAPSDLLGSGAYGAVQLYKKDMHKQFHVHFDMPDEVAVKIFEPTKKGSLLKEIENYKSVDHPNIVKVFGTCELNRGRWGLVMEVYEDDLFHYVESPGAKITRPCDILDAKPILLLLAEALKYLRIKGIIHRDVKPENILVKTLPNGEIKVSLDKFINVQYI